MPDVTFTDITQLQAALARLTGPELTKVVERAARKIGEHLKGKMMRAPGPSHQPVKWASRKQRAAYFATRREAGLPIKYTRTSDPMSQKLGQRWAVRNMTGGAVLGNPATYAPQVQSAQYQTEMHEATGWITDAQAVEELERENLIAQTVMAEIHSMVKGVLG